MPRTKKAKDELPEVGPEFLQMHLTLAWQSPIAYSHLMIALVECQDVHEHDMHRLIFETLAASRRDAKSCVVVMPPESGKTTIVAFWLAWVRSHFRVRVGITAGDEGRAKKSLMLIRKALLSPEHQAMFPHIRPDNQRSMSRGEWSATRLYLEGDSGPSFEMFPFEGHAEGARVDILWMDDVVGASCKTSQADRERIHGIIHGTWLNRITGRGFSIVTNNVWHREDPIHRMAQSPSFHTLWLGYEGTERIYWRVNSPCPTWRRGVEGTLPLWEKVWPQSRLLDKYHADRLYYKQMFGGKAMLAEECRFPPAEEWQTYNDDELASAVQAGGKVYAHLDPSGGKRVKKNDFAAIALVMIGPKKTIYVLDVMCWRDLPAKQAKALWDLNEQVARMSGLRGISSASVEVLPNSELWIKPELRRLQEIERESGNSLDIRTITPTESKESRIDSIVRHFTNGWIKFPKDFKERMTRQDGHWREFVNQIEDYPLGDHDDAPDALAYAVDMAERRGMRGKPNGAGERSEMEAWQRQLAEDEKQNSSWRPMQWDEWGREVSREITAKHEYF